MGELGLKYKGNNGEEMFDIEIGKMSKSNMIKYCQDEWIVILAETMKRLRGKRRSWDDWRGDMRGFGLFM